MDGILLTNPSGNLGIAVINEERKIQGVVYDSISKNLLITFSNGDDDQIPTEIAPEFGRQLHSRKEIYIGHFRHDSLDQDPSSEYMVRLSL